MSASPSGRRSAGDLARAVADRLVRVHRYVVYDAPAADVARAPAAGVTCRPMTDDEVLALERGPAELRPNAPRLRRYGFNTAYALHIDGALAHVAWMLGHDEQRRAGAGNVRLAKGDVEIAHCVTVEGARGRGAYGLSIGALAALAAARGTTRVVMVVNARNAASRRGVEKAGLRASGTLTKVVLPWLRAWRGLRVHRRDAGA